MAIGKNLGKMDKKGTESLSGSPIVDPKSVKVESMESALEVPKDEKNVELQKINEELQNEGSIDSKLMLIVFPVGSEEYALPIDMVSEVVKIPPVALIPQVPEHIKGVANIRGTVFAILDLAKKIGLNTIDDETEHKYVLVIQSEDYKMALAVSQVPDTLMISRDEIDQSPTVMTQSSLNEAYVQGIVKKDQRMIILVNIMEMLSNDQLVTA